METQYHQFTAGQQVKTIFGAQRTVLLQRGCQVWLEEESFGWHHAANLFPV